MELQRWWWGCFSDTFEHELSRDSTTFYTWELIWSRIMDNTWLNEARTYLFLCRLVDGTLQMMGRTSWTWMGHIKSWFDEMISSYGGDTHMGSMLQMRWGLLHGPEHGLHLYGDGFLIELRMWQDVLRNNWWWHEEVRFHGLSVHPISSRHEDMRWAEMC